jgi:hypothetical protein
MRGSKPGFWKTYEAQQISLIASCMPKAAAVSGVKPIEIKAPLAFYALPGRLTATSNRLY